MAVPKSESRPDDARPVIPDHGELEPHTLYSCPRWARVLECGGRVPTLYLTAEEGGRPVGFLAYHVNTSTANPAYSIPHLTRNLPKEIADRPWSYAGPLSAYQCDIPVIVSQDPSESTDKLIRLAQTHSERDGQSLAIPYLTTSCAGRLSADLRSSLLLEDFECWFTSGANNLDEYRATAPRKQRQNLNRDRRLFREAGLIDGVEPTQDCMEEFVRLVGASARRYGQSHSDSGLIEHLSCIASVFGSEAVVFTARQRRKLVGGALGIFHDDDLYLRMTGFDYIATARASAYFQLAYYAPLEYRSQRAHVRVHHGSELLGMKHRHGARPVPLWTLLLGADLPSLDYDRANQERFNSLTPDLPPGVATQLWSDTAAVVDP